MSPPDWKKRSVGKGNASKTEVQEWCSMHGFPFVSEDEADACAIAFAGRARTRHLADACVVAADPCPACAGPVDEWADGRKECRACLVREL